MFAQPGGALSFKGERHDADARRRWGTWVKRMPTPAMILFFVCANSRNDLPPRKQLL